MLYTLDALIMAINAFLIMTSLFILCKDFLRNPNGVLMNIYSFSLVFALFYYGVPFLMSWPPETPDSRCILK
ncbi:Uncharacterised protein [Escherichia coli]|nr:Uncharacterised protein [Escherichia coli]